jgi:predicted ATPase/DNA-binding NarL/FixJ family response regulator
MSAARRSVPRPSAPLVGREPEVARIAELLTGGEARLVTLTGPGGVGKTFLALHAAGRIETDLPDGAVFVPLGGVDDPRRVAPAVARALGLREAGTRSLEDQLKAHLRRRRLLLVLDNFEHLPGAVPLVSELLADCPSLQALATSRSSLRLAGEHELAVSPLELADAVELLLHRARAVAPDFALAPGDADTIEEICRRLDGLPLAIELAAARAKILAPEEILERATSPLSLLTGGRRDAPARQRTLRATIDWSYALLNEDDRRMFRALAVFQGGCTIHAAAAVVGAGTDDPAVLDTLDSLVDKSLVRAVPQGASTRLHLLETIREFACEKLLEAGERERCVDAHAAFFLRLTETLDPRLSSPDSTTALERIDVEYDNLLAALEALLDSGDGRAVELAAAIWRLWHLRGRLSEGRAWLERVLSARGPVSPPMRARAGSGAAVLALHQADYEAAASLAADALALFRENGDQAGAGSALRTLALVARDQGEHATARSLAHEAAKAALGCGDAREIALARSCLARVEFFAGDYRASAALHAEALAALDESGSLPEVAGERLFLAWCLLVESRPDEARPLFESALQVARRFDDRWSTALALGGLLRVAAGGGDLTLSREHGLEALALCVAIDERFLGAMSLVGLIDSLEPSVQTARLLGAADRLRESVGARWPVHLAKEYRRAIEAARVALAPDALAVAFTEGRGLSLEEAAREVEVAARPEPRGVGDVTDREAEVLRLVARGLTNRQVAAELVVSERTVHAHLRSAYRKLGLSSRSAATRYVLEHGIA